MTQLETTPALPDWMKVVETPEDKPLPEWMKVVPRELDVGETAETPQDRRDLSRSIETGDLIPVEDDDDLDEAASQRRDFDEAIAAAAPTKKIIDDLFKRFPHLENPKLNPLFDPDDFRPSALIRIGRKLGSSFIALPFRTAAEKEFDRGVQLGRLALGGGFHDQFSATLPQEVIEGFASTQTPTPDPSFSPSFADHPDRPRSLTDRAAEALSPYTERLAGAIDSIQNDLSMPPPESVGEYVADAAGGLGAFIWRLMIVRRVLGAKPGRNRAPRSKITGFAREIAAWGIEAELGEKGRFAHGAGMSLMLQAIGKLPGARAPFKLLLESAAFGAVAAVEGADEVDMYIMIAIPWAMRAPRALQALGYKSMAEAKLSLAQRLRAARTDKDLSSALDAVKEFDTLVREEHAFPDEHVPDKAEMDLGVENYARTLKGMNKTKKANLMREFRQAMYRQGVQGKANKEARETIGKLDDKKLYKLWQVAKSPGKTTVMVGNVKVSLETFEAELARRVRDKDKVADKKAETKATTEEIKENNKILEGLKDDLVKTQKFIELAKKSGNDTKAFEIDIDRIKSMMGEIENELVRLKSPTGEVQVSPEAKARFEKGEFVSVGKIPGTEFSVRDEVRIGKGPRAWLVMGGRRDSDGNTRLLIVRNVPDPKVEGGRKQQRFWAKADRLNKIRGVDDDVPIFDMPDAVAAPVTQAPAPTTLSRILYNLGDPKAYIVGQVSQEGRVEKVGAKWGLRRPDGVIVPVDNEIIQKLIDDGTIVKLGENIWGIPNERMPISRDQLAELDFKEQLDKALAKFPEKEGLEQDRRDGQCNECAELIEKEFGFPTQEGVWTPGGDIERGIRTREIYSHKWNILPDGRILDVSAGQFYDVGPVTRIWDPKDAVDYTTIDNVRPDLWKKVQEIVQSSTPSTREPSTTPDTNPETTIAFFGDQLIRRHGIDEAIEVHQKSTQIGAAIRNDRVDKPHPDMAGTAEEQTALRGDVLSQDMEILRYLKDVKDGRIIPEKELAPGQTIPGTDLTMGQEVSVVGRKFPHRIIGYRFDSNVGRMIDVETLEGALGSDQALMATTVSAKRVHPLGSEPPESGTVTAPPSPADRPSSLERVNEAVENNISLHETVLNRMRDIVADQQGDAPVPIGAKSDLNPTLAPFKDDPGLEAAKQLPEFQQLLLESNRLGEDYKRLLKEQEAVIEQLEVDARAADARADEALGAEPSRIEPSSIVFMKKPPGLQSINSWIKDAKTGLVRLYHGTTKEIAKKIKKEGFVRLTVEDIIKSVYERNGIPWASRKSIPKGARQFIESDARVRIETKEVSATKISFAPYGVAKRWAGHGGEIAHEVDRNLRQWLAAKKDGVKTTKQFFTWLDSDANTIKYRSLGAPIVVSAIVRLDPDQQARMVRTLEGYQRDIKEGSITAKAGASFFDGNYMDVLLDSKDIGVARPNAKRAPSKKLAQAQLDALVVEGKNIQRRIDKVEELLGGREETTIMSGSEQAQILGPHQKGIQRTFEQARRVLENVKVQLDESTDIRRTFLGQKTPTKPLPLNETEQTIKGLEAQLADLRARIDNIESVRSIRKPGADPEIMSIYQQRALMGGDPSGIKTFKQARKFYDAQIKVLVDTIEYHKLRAAKKGGPVVVGRVGEGEPVVEGDVTTDTLKPRKVRLNTGATKPKAISLQEFLENYKQNVYIIAQKTMRNVQGDTPEAIYEQLIAEGRIKRPFEAAPETVTQSALVLRRQRDFTVGELPSEEVVDPPDPALDVAAPAVKVTPETSVGTTIESNEHLNRMRKAILEMEPEHAEILARRYGVDTGKIETLPEVARKMGITVDDALALEREAYTQLVIRTGQEPPGTSVEAVYSRHNPTDAMRRGLWWPGQIWSAGKLPLKLLNRFARFQSYGPFLLIKDSTPGSDEGKKVFLKGMETIDEIAAQKGKYAAPSRRAGRKLNRQAFNGAYTIQERPFSVSGIRYDRVTGLIVDKLLVPLGAVKPKDLEKIERSVSGLPVAGATWVVDPILDIVNGDIRPESGSQHVVSHVVRQVERITGKDLVDARIENRKTNPDGTVEVRLFKATPGGRVFPAFPSRDFFAILKRGPGDPLWDIAIDGFTAVSGKDRSKVAKFFADQRESLTAGDPEGGVRHVGAEFTREYRRRPTAIRDKSGKRIQLFHTNPRTIVDMLFETTAMRIGFTKILGQDGQKIRDMKKPFVAAGGNQYDFDDAFRALSDIPPKLIGRGHNIPESPSDPGWEGTHILIAGQEVYKQFLLTATAIIQIPETLIFGTRFGIRRVVSGFANGLIHYKSTQDMMMEVRATTKPVMNFILNREHATADLLNKLSGFISRLHFNRISNEMVNEQLAALQGMQSAVEIMERGKAYKLGNGPKPRAFDYYNLHRTLNFDAETTSRILRGRGTDAEHNALIRRMAEWSTGSISLMAEKSKTRNSSIFRISIPFTGYFNNRVRMISRDLKGTSETTIEFNAAHKKYKNDPNVTNLKAMRFARGQGLQSFNALGRQLMGTVGGALLGQYLWAALREGPEEAFDQMVRDFKYDKLNFFTDLIVWSTFGPIWGMLYETTLSAGASEVSTDQFMRRQASVVMPIAIILDARDMVLGLGPYKDRSWGEKAKRFMSLHTPAVNTIPGQYFLSVLGVEMEDVATQNAVKEAWRWIYDVNNGVVPPGGGSPGSQTADDKRLGILLRRGIEELIIGGSVDHWAGIEKAVNESKRTFLAAERLNNAGVFVEKTIQRTLNPTAYLRSKVIFNQQKLTDESRARLRARLGPKKSELIDIRDHIFVIAMVKSNMMYGDNSLNNEYVNFMENWQWKMSQPLLFPDPFPE